MSLRSLMKLSSTDLSGKRVLLRVDYNVPLANGKVVNDTRIQETIPTIQYLLDQGAAVIICSHLGRPKGQVVEELRLDPIARRLEKLLHRPVKKVFGCIEDTVQEIKAELKSGEVLLLENTRFYPEEEKNDRAFSKLMANHCDFFISDAFGCVHRAHASTVGVAEFLPAYAGLLVQREVEHLTKVLESPNLPMAVIVGGAKIDSKIGVISNFFLRSESIIIGGALANTFLAAKGFSVGHSLCEEDKIDLAKKILNDSVKYGDKIKLPKDVVVAKDADDTNCFLASIDQVAANDKIFDVGKETIDYYILSLRNVKTIIWNGPLGLFEKDLFAEGTKRLANYLATCDAETYLGGGDTIEAIDRFGIAKDNFTHVSTGGGAMLEFLEGKKLPGIAILGH